MPPLSRRSTVAALVHIGALSAACAPAPPVAPASVAAPSDGADGDMAEPASGVRPAQVVVDPEPSKEVWELEEEPLADATKPWAPPAAVPLVRPLAEVPVADGDPVRGRFSLDEASAGIEGKGQLHARLKTDRGDIECELWPHRAPLTVANFVGLARGLRPFKDPTSSSWVRRPAYDGTVFHRIIPGFMIQGGDPTGSGTGDAGFVIPDEIWEGSTHALPGLLCMANRGPNTGGMQFFITDGRLDRDLSYLDGSYTVFGRCLHTDVIASIARVKAYGDRPEVPPRVRRVEVFRQIP